MNTNTVNKNEINQSAINERNQELRYDTNRCFEIYDVIEENKDEVRAFFKKMFARADLYGDLLSTNNNRKFVMLCEGLGDLVECCQQSIEKGIHTNKKIEVLYELFNEMVEAFKSDIYVLSFDINHCVQDEEEE